MKLFWTIIKLSGAAILFVAIIGYLAGLGGYVLTYSGSEFPLIDGPMAVMLGIVGAVLFLIGYLLVKRAQKKDPDDKPLPQLDVNNLSFIASAIKRTRRRNLWAGILLVVFGGLMGIVPFADPEAEPTSGTGIAVLCIVALMLIIGTWMLIKAIGMMNVEDTVIYKKIIFEPKTINALSAQIIENPYTKYGRQINATIHYDSKKLPVLSVSENELELLRQYLMKHNPQLAYNAY